MKDNKTGMPPALRLLMQVSLILVSVGILPNKCLASRSLVVNPATRTTRAIPEGMSGWKELGSYRLEGRITLNTPASVPQSIFRVANDLGIALDSTGNIFAYLRGAAGGGFCPLNGGKEIRFRLRRDITASLHSFEVWNEITGTYCSSTQVDPNPTPYDISGGSFAVGSVYDPQSPDMEIGFLRFYSDPKSLSAIPPQRFISSNYGDLFNFEFENNLNDLSGRNLNLSMTVGSPTYRDTPVFAPRMSVNYLKTARAGSPQLLQATGYTNDDNPNLSVTWNQVNGPFEGLWSQQTTNSIYFTPTLAGSYDLRAIATTQGGQNATENFTLGAVLTDTNDVVIVPDANISSLLGPLIRHGANPWTWFDDRAVTVAQYQIDMQTGANGSPAFWSSEPWSTLLSGSITVVNGSNVVTGAGTQFQTDFCGGAGNTTPSGTYGQIYIRYNSAEYPDTKGLARYNVTECTSQTSLKVNQGWGHATGTQSALQYSRADVALAGWWTNTNTPGNYYDNVLALYTLYYRTGLVKYRDAARTLAHNFWYGPFYDRGKNYDLQSMGGTFVSAGPARGQSITGLILWSLDTGENIWPGMNYVLNAMKDFGWTYAQSRSWNVQIGDLREQGYLTASYALAARYHPDAATRQLYRGYLKDYVNLFWSPLQLPTGEWRNTVVTNAGYYGANAFVTVTNGSATINVTGGSWTASTFHNGNFPGAVSNFQNTAWFFSNYTNNDLPGRQNSDLGGEETYYRVVSVQNGTTATLDRPYEGTSGNKGLIVSSLAGFGTQPFMMALTAGVFGTYVYDTLNFYGDAVEAAKVRQFTIDAGNWLASPAAYKAAGHYNYGGSTFLNCKANPDSPGCAGDTVLNGEGMRGLAASYLFTRSDATLAQGDDLFSAVWCKPTGGWVCGSPAVGTYGFYLDDPPTGFMLNKLDPLTNKWFGFFFGYGFGASWPAARVGGLQPPSNKQVSLQIDFNSIPGTATIRVTMLYPNGSYNQASCTESPCSIPVTGNTGNPIMRLEHYTAEDALLSTGEWTLLTVD